MIIVLDLDEGRVILKDPGSFKEFSVRVDGGREFDQVLELVESSGLGRLRDDQAHVVVDPDVVRRLAGASADEAWEQGFAGMCAYAAGKGWMEDGGILAHIEWPDA
jgi:hypothetical protein